MNRETKRTVIYLAVAALSIGAAAFAHYSTRPKEDVEYVNVGKPFYESFNDPTTAQALRVVAYDEDKASVKEFKVEYRDGRWQIPSHHEYPADGKDRLVQTAASVIDVKRGALATRRKSDHARFNVIDPDDQDASVLKGRGDKVTLSKTDGTVLAEFIVGKKAEGQQDAFYVRAPREDDGDAVYLAKLKIDLSTKFGDWIEPDLLKLDRERLRDIRIDTYSIDEQRGVLVEGEKTELKKGATAGDQWALTGLKPAEELKMDAVNQLVNGLDDVKIVGVRPKQKGINADLSLDQRVTGNREIVAILRNEMMNRGFFIASDPKTKQQHVVSKEGELFAGLDNGVQYSLHFGQIFTGTDFEVETGLSKDKDKKTAEPAKDEAAKKDETTKKDGKDAPKEADKADDKSKEGQKRSRYLMVYAKFDPKLAGPPPTKPTEPVKLPGIVLDDPKAPTKPAEPPKADAKPTEPPKSTAPKSTVPKAEPKPADKPAPPAKTDGKQSQLESIDGEPLVPVAYQAGGETPAKDAPPKTETPKAEPAKNEPAKADSPKPEPAKAPATKEAPKTEPAKSEPKPAEPEKKADETPAEEKKPDPKAEYLKAMDQYKKDVERYENDKKEYEKKLEQGKEEVKKLNERFGPWYYVISAESFENLRLERKALVQPKEKPADAKDGAASPPTLPFPPAK